MEILTVSSRKSKGYKYFVLLIPSKLAKKLELNDEDKIKVKIVDIVKAEASIDEEPRIR